jgi:uncharacterized protein YjbJ (UPF0337 family)
MSGTADKIQGKAKETLGAATGDDSLEREGKTDHAVGVVKDKLDDAKEWAEDKLDDAKDDEKSD